MILPTLPGLSGASDDDSAHDYATADALAKGTAFRHSETTVTPTCNTDSTSAFCRLGNVQGSANEQPECSKPQCLGEVLREAGHCLMQQAVSQSMLLPPLWLCIRGSKVNLRCRSSGIIHVDFIDRVTHVDLVLTD